MLLQRIHGKEQQQFEAAEEGSPKDAAAEDYEGRDELEDSDDRHDPGNDNDCNTSTFEVR